MTWLALGLIPAAWLAAVFQTSLAPSMAIRGASPDALALLAAVLLLAGPVDRRAAWLSAGLGFAADLISPGPLGVGMFSFFLAAQAILALRTRLSVDPLPIRVVMTAGFATLAALGIALGYTASGDAALPLGTFLGRVLGVGLYTAAISVPVHMVLSWLPSPIPSAS